MTTNFNVRLDDQLKAESFGVIESFGMTPSQFIRLVLKQVADTGSLPLSFERRPNHQTMRAMQELDNGGGTLYTSLDDMLAELGDAASQDK